MAGPSIRVCVVEADYLAREGLSHALENSETAEVVSTCETAERLRPALLREHPDVVVTALRLPPSFTDEGVRLAAQLEVSDPEVGVVVLAERTDALHALSLFGGRLYRRAYLLRERIQGSNELIRAVQEVAAGRSLIDPAAVESLVNVGERPAARLTAREREVLELIAAAESNSAIAQELGITVRAVERHVNSIFRKLGLVESDAVNRRVKAALVFASAEKR